MTNNVVQVRMPYALLKNIEELVKRGYYKNKSEVIIDGMRHFVGTKQPESDIAQYLRDEIHGRHSKQGYSKKEIDDLWKKVESRNEWKKRFGSDADSVMASIRGRQ
jgi:Arc/MetJ-type ribon-helix-helix transcriptional regulator